MHSPLRVQPCVHPVDQPCQKDPFHAIEVRDIGFGRRNAFQAWQVLVRSYSLWLVEYYWPSARSADNSVANKRARITKCPRARTASRRNAKGTPKRPFYSHHEACTQRVYLAGREGRTTTAGSSRIGIADHELRTFEVFFVIDLGANQILETHRINQ